MCSRALLIIGFCLPVCLSQVESVCLAEASSTGNSGHGFDCGVHYYAEAEPSPELDMAEFDELTLECWVYAKETGKIRHALSKGNTYLLRLNMETSVALKLTTTEGFIWCWSSPGSLPANRWVHLAGTWDGKMARLFVNGGEQDKCPIGGHLQTTPEGFKVGRPIAEDSGSLAFLTDEVRVWSEARTPEQIVEFMRKPLYGTEPHLEAYWRLDEGAGQWAEDSGPNDIRLRLGSTEQADDRDPLWTLTDLPGFGPLVTSSGVVDILRDWLPCVGDIRVRVADTDLSETDFCVVSIWNDDQDREEVTLSPDVRYPGIFLGSVPSTGAAGIPGDGTLEVADGQVVTATYADADDGSGWPAVREDVAHVDCIPPTISEVITVVTEAEASEIAFSVDEPAAAVIRFGIECGEYTDFERLDAHPGINTAWLQPLYPDTGYLFVVAAEDRSGNTTINDNNETCFPITTLPPPDRFAEQFEGGDFDLAFTSLTFFPDGSEGVYRMCVQPETAFPTDPAGGTVWRPGPDSGRFVSYSGTPIPFYGLLHQNLSVGSNGYVGFETVQGTVTETFQDHFKFAKISGLFRPLDYLPGTGRISWRELDDRVAFTFENVSERGTTNSNNFQIEMHFDGTIRITYLRMDATSGIVGLAEGRGIPPAFVESDLSESSSCPGADDLLIHPEGALSILTGPASAKPASVAYTLTNPGSMAIDWTLGFSCRYLDVTPIAGHLASGESQEVSISLNDLADLVDCRDKTYYNLFTFTDISTGHEQSRSVNLINVCSEEPMPLPGDTTGDGAVDCRDLFMFSTFWGDEGGDAGPACDADGNGTVNEKDLLRLIDYWRPWPVQN